MEDNQLQTGQTKPTNAQNGGAVVLFSPRCLRAMSERGEKQFEWHFFPFSSLTSL